MVFFLLFYINGRCPLPRQALVIYLDQKMPSSLVINALLKTLGNGHRVSSNRLTDNEKNVFKKCFILVISSEGIMKK